MNQYEAIDRQVQLAHQQRSAYLADLFATGLVACVDGIRAAGQSLLGSARTGQSRKNLFTFDA